MVQRHRIYHYVVDAFLQKPKKICIMMGLRQKLQKQQKQFLWATSHTYSKKCYKQVEILMRTKFLYAHTLCKIHNTSNLIVSWGKKKSTVR